MTIEIRDLEVWCHIGVTKQERDWPQKILISVTFAVPLTTTDEIQSTTDYARVSDTIREEVSKRPRQLLETLAQDISKKIQSSFGVIPSLIEIKKFVIPSSACVVLKYSPASCGGTTA